MSESLNILIRGPLWTGWTSGYCAFTRDIFGLFNAITPNVRYQFHRRDDIIVGNLKNYFLKHGNLQDKYYDSDDISHFDIVINIGTPAEVELIPHLKNVLYTFWETDLINTYDLGRGQSWTDLMNKYNEVWSSSNFALEVYKKSGVTSNLRVIRWPMTFDDNERSQLSDESSSERIFNPKEHLLLRLAFEACKKWGIASKIRGAKWPIAFGKKSVAKSIDGFNFNRLFSSKKYSLNEIIEQHKCVYFSCGEFQPRKNFEQMIHSFLLALGKESKVCLILKVSLGSVSKFKDSKDLIKYIESKFASYSGTLSNIYIICSHIPKAALMSIHCKASFYVTTSKGEGLGGPIIDAMKEKTPIIAHTFSSFKDFLSQDNAILFDYHLENVIGMPFPAYSALQKWAAFKTKDIVSAFSESYEIYGTEKYTELSESAKSKAFELFEFNNVKKGVTQILGSNNEIIN